MSNMFYRAFEERHRGSRELIMSRLAIYLPFIEPLKKFQSQPEALDLGCGRGEWLELLQKHKFLAKGIDLEEGMLLACKERNLNVMQGNALDYLKELPAESISIISAFHFVEHIPFEALRQLIDEAHRVLKPGGLLIMETPNSENLLVGTSSFYLDPTHHRPLPASLLSFLVEYVNFARVKTIFLQESLKSTEKLQVNLRSILEKVSPDYAVIAQKKADRKIFDFFNTPFNRDYGVRLLALVDLYDQQIQAQINNISQELAELKNFYTKVWQIKTSMSIQPKRVKNLLGRILKRARKLILNLPRLILIKTGLIKIILRILNRFPYLKKILRRIILKQHSITRILFSFNERQVNSSAPDLSDLSPYTADIFNRLRRLKEQGEPKI